MSQDVTQKTVLNLLSAALFQKPFSVSDNINWDKVFLECREQSVLALAFSTLPIDVVPIELYNTWKNECSIALAENSKVSYAHTLVHELLLEFKIPYVIIKGCVSADYYDNPVLRTMGDVDFLVQKSNVDKTEKILLLNGFKKKGSHQSVECSFEKDDIIFELHWDVIGIPNNEIGNRIHEYLSDVFECSSYKRSELAHYYSLSHFHHGLIMLLHVARHMITGGIGLRHFCDWAVFVEKIGDDFPVLFESKLKKIGLWHFAQILSQFCVIYFGETYSLWMGKIEKKLLCDLKTDIFAGGNFGHKDLSRADESKFITSQKGGISNNSNLRQAVIAANDIVRKHWSFADKVPVAYPVGWAFFGGRYAFRALIGKRKKINVTELTKAAEKRKEIYKELKLFEKEKQDVAN